MLLSETWNAGGTLEVTARVSGTGHPSPVTCAHPDRYWAAVISTGALGGEPEWSFSVNSEYYFRWPTPPGLYVRGLFGTPTIASTPRRPPAPIMSRRISSHARSWICLWAGAPATIAGTCRSGPNLTDEDAVVFQQGPDQYDIAISDGSYTQTNTVPERILA